MTVERVCPLAKFTEHGSEGKSAMCRNKPEVHLCCQGDMHKRHYANFLTAIFQNFPNI